MTSILRHVIYLLGYSVIMVSMNSCGVWKNDPPPASHPVAAKPVTASNDNALPTPAPVSTVDGAQTGTHEPVESTWIFTVDPKRSKGKLNLRFDPKGTLLGSKPSKDISPLKGHILMTVSTDRTGIRNIKLKDVTLTNTTALAMPFQWSRLMGGITVNIPVNVLKITKHTFQRACRVNRDGSFRLRRNNFKVGGSARVEGSGLILSRAVGNRKVDLTIRKTENVEVAGSLTIDQDVATLRIPSAVMRDSFNMEGSMLDLVFTGEIVATAQAH